MTEKTEVNCNFPSTTRYERRGRRHNFNVSPSEARILGGEGGGDYQKGSALKIWGFFFGKRGTFATVVKKCAIQRLDADGLPTGGSF